MKKKKWRISVCVVGIVLLIFIAGIIVTLGIVSARGYSLTIGRCLIASDGSYMLIDDNSPIVMSDQSIGGNLFRNLSTGDKILVLHDGVEESYPGRTGAYGCIRLGSGDISDISENVIEQLSELGWLSEADKLQRDTETCRFSAQYVRTNGYHEEIEYPVVEIIRSVEELNAYYEGNKETYDLERKDKVYADTTIGFLDACDKYDDAYFEKQVLVFVLLEEGSGSTRHKVTSVGVTSKEELLIYIETQTPETGTCDMAEWHIFVEPEAGVQVADESNITVFLDNRNVTNKSKVVAYSHGNANMSLKMIGGWEYEINEYTKDCVNFGISFWPKGHSEGKVSLQYYPNGFGVCGTGLSGENITIGGYKAYKGTYDNNRVWDFISFQDVQGSYVVMNEGANTWWNEYGNEAMFILATVNIAKDMMN